jgi:hypothetical protein
MARHTVSDRNLAPFHFHNKGDMALIVSYQRGVYTRTFAHRLSNSRAKRGKPILSPFVPETFICFHTGKQRWTARDGSGVAKTHARVVWEHHNGPVPDGYHVHHKNGDPTDYHNDCIENLMLLTAEWNLDYMPKLARGFGVPESEVTSAYLKVEHLPYSERFPAVCRLLLGAEDSSLMLETVAIPESIN